MEFSIPFGGQALNAVDGKGRVSLPADLRATVDRRAAQALAANMPVDDKLLYIAEDEELPCLTGFDETEYFALAGELREQRSRETSGGGRKSLIRRDGGGTETFAPLQRVVFDKAGRMVMSSLLREIGGIEDFAFFTGNGPYFDIWSPARAHSHYAAMGDKRLLRVLEHLCREKGVAL